MYYYVDMNNNEALIKYWKILNFEFLTLDLPEIDAKRIALQGKYFPINETLCLVETLGGGIILLTAKDGQVFSMDEKVNLEKQ